MHRIALIGLLAVAGAACGVPSLDAARLRTPASGARVTFARPYADVYRASKTIIESAQDTPEWKELRLRVDDPEAGVLIAERRLEGVIPGIRVRDLWSFYVTRVSATETQVSFVIESSDHPRATVSARSWAKGHGTIFPAMREILDTGAQRVESGTPASAADSSVANPVSTPHPPSRAPTAVAAAPSAPAAAPAAAGTDRTSRAIPPPTSALDRAYNALRESDDWRGATRERTVEGERVVMVGAWAQLTEREGRVQVAFPTYPAPPAYEVARLMRFLADARLAVDVLPGSTFRSP